VVNEDGVVLLDAPGFWGVGLFNTNSGAKMVLTYFNGSSKVNVYSLSGKVLESYDLGNNSDSHLFPNPSSDRVNISYDVPVNELGLVLSVYTIKGEIIDQRNVDSGSKNIQIDVSRLTAGIYFYRIYNDDFSTVTKKFIVTK